MRRMTLLPAVLVAFFVCLPGLLAPSGGPSPVRAQAMQAMEEPACRALPLFAALQTLLGVLRVGSCAGGERTLEDGTVEQPTAGGLLFWRPWEGTPSFTDGRRTWLHGLAGLVWERDSAERFDWEPPPLPSAVGGEEVHVIGTGWQPATPAPCLPTVDAWRSRPSDVTALVRNECGEARLFGLSMALSDAPAGRPVATTGGVTWSAPAGDSRTVVLPARTIGAASATFLRTAAPPVGTLSELCVDVGAARCLMVDSWLYGTVAALRTVDEGADLLRSAADGYAELRWGDAPFGALAFYNFTSRVVTLDRDALERGSDWERAALLAHELQHAADSAAGMPFGRGPDCLAREADAHQAAGRVWLQLWRGRLPVATTGVQRLLNGDGLAAFADPAQLARTLMLPYRPQCGTG